MEESFVPPKRSKLTHPTTTSFIPESDPAINIDPDSLLEDAMYNDLFEFEQSKDFVRLTARLDAAEKKNIELASELVEMRSQLEVILVEKQRLEDNITLVYNTAVRELARKDKEITELKCTTVR